MGSSKMSKTKFLGAIFVEKFTIYYKYLETKLNKNTHFNSISKLEFFCHPQSYGLRVTYKLIICVCVCMFLTTLLLVNTTDTGFSLVDFNDALEMILLVWPVQG